MVDAECYRHRGALHRLLPPPRRVPI